MHALRRGKVFAPTGESKKRKRDLGCLSRPLLLPSAAGGWGGTTASSLHTRLEVDTYFKSDRMFSCVSLMSL